jgi:hypothetical protein
VLEAEGAATVGDRVRGATSGPSPQEG